MSAEEDDLERMLKSIFGEEGARSILESMRARGIDPHQLAAAGMVPTNPVQMGLAMQQIRALMQGTDGPVNWSFARELAQSQIASKDTVITQAQATRAAQRLAEADLWLDAVTDFVAPGAQRQAWSRRDWLENTLPVWKQITEPVANNIARAFNQMLSERLGSAGFDEDGAQAQFSISFNGANEIPGLPSFLASNGDDGLLGGMLSDPQKLVRTMSSAIYGLQLGNALAQVATSALTSSDGALPLVEGATAALVLPNIDELEEELTIPATEVDMYIAVREAARLRLFTTVPWLRAHLFGAIEEYAKNIQIDTAAIDDAMSQMQQLDPTQLQEMEPIALFETAPSAAQEKALDELETLLATVEGWVEVVATRACAPHLGNVGQLKELLRRRAVTGARADDVLANLIGLQLRPRRAHLAARLWELVTAERGDAGRDLLWRHPDVCPTSSELDHPEEFLQQRQAQADSDAEVDAELDAMLSGTLGWAEGLSPDQDSEGDLGQQ